MEIAEKIKNELENLGSKEKAISAQKFFKTGKGEYREGDIFIGITVPEQRKVAKKFQDIASLTDIQKLLGSKIHEHRQVALIILVEKFKKVKKDKFKKREIYEFYLKNTKRINNWDLVDISAPHIIGEFSREEIGQIPRYLAKSENLWERRIAIVSSYAFIKKRFFGETLVIADILMNDKHDLIHKAVGWMLREIGKKNQQVLEIFLSTRYKKMPRTMLRYSIEKFPKELRKKYMKK